MVPLLQHKICVRLLVLSTVKRENCLHIKGIVHQKKKNILASFTHPDVDLYEHKDCLKNIQAAYVRIPGVSSSKKYHKSSQYNSCTILKAFRSHLIVLCF